MTISLCIAMNIAELNAVRNAVLIALSFSIPDLFSMLYQY